VNTPTETCDECGFDADEWNDQDTERTVASASALIALWTDSMPESARNVRPSAERWSVNEYVDHLREVFFGMRMLIELALEEPGRDLGPMPKPGGPGPHRTLDSQATASGFETVASALATSIRSLEADQWSYSVAFDGLAHSATWASRHSVHDLQHHLADIADIRVSIGDATPPTRGPSPRSIPPTAAYRSAPSTTQSSIDAAWSATARTLGNITADPGRRCVSGRRK